MACSEWGRIHNLCRRVLCPRPMFAMFLDACDHGDLAEAKRLFSLGGMNIHALEEVCFRWACWRGHLVVAQWLYGQGGVDIHAHNDLPFRRACEYGHLAVAQWLFALGGVDTRANNDAGSVVMWPGSRVGLA